MPVGPGPVPDGLAPVRGRLAAASTAPPEGETVTELVAAPGLSVCHVLSGQLPAPLDFCQDDDELAIVLEGSAVLEMGGRTLGLDAGEWLWLPAGTAHRLVSTQPGTRWLTVHRRPTANE